MKSPKGLAVLVCGLLAAVLFLPGTASQAGDRVAPSSTIDGECALEAGPPERPNIPIIRQDVVLLIDSSGSMTMNDPTNCRLVAARNYIDNLTSPDRVSIVDFDGVCRWAGPDHHLDSPGHDGVPDYSDPVADVGQIDSMGGTDIVCAINGGNTELASRGNPSHLWIEILLTDGIAGDPALILAEAQNAANLGIRIFTVGFGTADVPLLQQIADITGGRYYDGSSCTLIINAYGSIMNLLGSSASSAPLAPGSPQGSLVGPDVHLQWALSPDDGAGADDIAYYEVWHGSTYDTTAGSYSRLAIVPRNVGIFDHVGAGDGDLTNHFYQIQVVDISGQMTASAEQAAKLAWSLPAGDHLLGMPLLTASESAEDVLQTLPWTSARTYVDGQWQSHHRRSGESLSLPLGSAFWVRTSAPDSWTLVGSVPLTASVSLHTGWNLVGFASLYPQQVGNAMAGVTYQTMEGFTPAPPYNLRRLGTGDLLDPGQGYWILVSADAVWTFSN